MSRLAPLLCLLFLASGPTSAQTPRPWTEYRTILWMGTEGQKHKGDPKLVARLRELGINTGMVGGGGDPQWYAEAGLGHYVENMISKGLCLKFRSKVTNWSKFVDEWKVARPEAGLVRDYSLEDPVWRNEVLKQMRDLAGRHAPFKPLAYDIRDELSVTISANPFDYDFAPVSLAAFREWLKTQYASLEALNAQWETKFATWEAVKPFTTDQIKHRMGTGQAEPAGKVDWPAARSVKFDPAKAGAEPTRWNLSPWADHRTYMDLTLARTLNDLRKAAHEVDPHTPVGIEGTQMPHAFGGYDLWRLSQVLDWVEPYDVCNSREILGSFMPRKPLLATVFEKETLPAQRRLWHLLLEGDRGNIIWWSEDVIDWSKPELPLTAKGQALAPVMKSLTTPLAKLFMLAERERDPIAIHYSQPSIQVAWLLESIPDGATWLRRFSSYESDHNRHAQMRNAWLKIFQDAGYSPTFISAQEVESGALKHRGLRALVLPGSRAMSDAEVQEIIRYSNGGGDLFGQGLAAFFNEHGRVRETVPEPLSRFAESGNEGALWVRQGAISTTSANLIDYVPGRLNAEFKSGLPAMIRELLGFPPPISIPDSARVRVHRFKAGGKARLLAFERNIEYKMREELAQAGGNEALEKPVTFKAAWETPGHVVNLRTGEKLGRVTEIEVQLDPWQPALFAVLEEEPKGDVVEALLKQLNGG